MDHLTVKIGHQCAFKCNTKPNCPDLSNKMHFLSSAIYCPPFHQIADTPMSWQAIPYKPLKIPMVTFFCWFLTKFNTFWGCLFTLFVLLSPCQQSPWWPKIFFSEGRRGELWVAICHNFAWSRHFPWTWKVRGSKKVTNSCSTKISRCWKCILCKFSCSSCTSHLLLEVSFIKAPYVCLMER